MPTRPRRAAPTAPPDLVLRVTIRDSDPAIWRLLHVPASLTLDRLHRVLQLVFGWQDYHLYEFEIGSRRFESLENDEAEGEDSRAVTLYELQPQVGDCWLYRYDFGDDWEHDIVVEKIEPYRGVGDDRWPALLDGARAGPPEDCGGVGGLERLLEELKRRRSTAGRESRAWVGAHYDPSRFDVWHVDRMLTLAAAYGAV